MEVTFDQIVTKLELDFNFDIFKIEYYHLDVIKIGISEVYAINYSN